MTSAESRENAFIASLGCYLCGSPALIHHDRRNGGKRKLAPKVPLCPYHHQPDSPEGLHRLGVKEFERRHGSVTAQAAIVAAKLEAAGMVPTWKKWLRGKFKS